MSSVPLTTAIGLTVFVLVGLWAAWHIRLWFQLQALRDTGAVAEGVVVDIIRDVVSEDHPDQLVVSYQFTPMGFDQAMSKSERMVAPRKIPNVGDRVVVRYDPKKPENARLDLLGGVSAF